MVTDEVGWPTRAYRSGHVRRGRAAKGQTPGDRTQTRGANMSIDHGTNVRGQEGPPDLISESVGLMPKCA